MSAAPSPFHSSSASFPKHFEYLSNDIDVDDLIKSLKCIRDVFENAVGESDLKPLYEEFKQLGETIVREELLVCRDLEKGSEKKARFV